MDADRFIVLYKETFSKSENSQESWNRRWEIAFEGLNVHTNCNVRMR